VDIQITFYSFAAGLVTFTLAVYFYSTYTGYVAERLKALREPGGEPGSFVFRVLKPFAGFFAHLLSSFFHGPQPKAGAHTPASYMFWLRVRVQRMLVAAGSPEGLTADEFLGLVCFSVLAWTCVGVALWAVVGWSFLVLAGLLGGVAHPALWLRRKMHRRKQQVRKLLPYALDLLTLSVEAGLDFVSALGRIALKLRGTPLGDEFEEMLRVIRLGKSRREALQDLAERMNMPEVVAFTTSLIQADELGASIDQVLRIQAEQLRNERYNLAEKKAMEAPVKILFPLIAFIFPTVFIILFAPIGISYLSRLFGF